MSAAFICVLYTSDADLARRIKAFLRAMALVRHVTDPNRMEAVLQQNSPAVILMDLRAKECRDTASIRDRKSTRLNSSHTVISYAVFCLKKKNGHKADDLPTQ